MTIRGKYLGVFFMSVILTVMQYTRSMIYVVKAAVCKQNKKAMKSFVQGFFYIQA
jgi:hypothetical protein